MNGIAWMVCPHCGAEINLKHAPAVCSAYWSTEDHLVAQGHQCATIVQLRNNR